MPFQPGHKPMGGRPKGSVSSKVRYEMGVMAWLKQKNLNILDLVNGSLQAQKQAISEIEDPVERAKALNELTKRTMELVPYVIPKVSPIEVEPEDVDTTATDLDSAVKEASSSDIIKVLRHLTDKNKS